MTIAIIETTVRWMDRERQKYLKSNIWLKAPYYNAMLGAVVASAFENVALII